MSPQEIRILEALNLIDGGARLSQRKLASKLSISLGSANQLVRNLAEQSLIRIKRTGRNCEYRLTEGGRNEKLRLLNRHYERHLDDYVTLRDRIGSKLSEIDPAASRVVFYGAGNLAEIAFIAAHASNCEFVGVVDDQRVGGRFLGFSVSDPTHLSSGHLNGKAFDTLVIASQNRSEEIRGRVTQFLQEKQVCCL